MRRALFRPRLAERQRDVHARGGGRCGSRTFGRKEGVRRLPADADVTDVTRRLPAATDVTDVTDVTRLPAEPSGANFRSARPIGAPRGGQAAFMEINPYKFYYSSYKYLSEVAGVVYMPSRLNWIHTDRMSRATLAQARCLCTRRPRTRLSQLRRPALPASCSLRPARCSLLLLLTRDDAFCVAADTHLLVPNIRLSTSLSHCRRLAGRRVQTHLRLGDRRLVPGQRQVPQAGAQFSDARKPHVLRDRVCARAAVRQAETTSLHVNRAWHRVGSRIAVGDMSCSYRGHASRGANPLSSTLKQLLDHVGDYSGVFRFVCIPCFHVIHVNNTERNLSIRRASSLGRASRASRVARVARAARASRDHMLEVSASCPTLVAALVATLCVATITHGLGSAPMERGICTIENAQSGLVSRVLFNGRRPADELSVKHGFFEAPLLIPELSDGGTLSLGWRGPTLLFSDHWDICGTDWVPGLCDPPAATLLLAHNLETGQTREIVHDIDAGVMSNLCGLTVDPTSPGTLIAADSLGQRIVRLIPASNRSHGGAYSMETITTSYQGKRFDGPNDVVVRSDGTIYFSDLWFNQYHTAQFLPRQGRPGLYSIRRDGNGRVVGEDFAEPPVNGVALAPGETQLYVTCTFQGRVDVFDVAANGALSNRRVALADRNLWGVPDGITVRPDGVLFVGTNVNSVGVWDPKTGFKQSLSTPLSAVSVALDAANWSRIYVVANQGVLEVAAPQCA